MTNDTIDLTLTAIDDTHDQIDALDAKSTKKRADLQERIKLLKQLQSLEKQFASFGKRGTERKKFRDDHADAHFALWMNVDPERVAWARAFLLKHDPAFLQKLDTEVRDDEYQRMRLKMIVYMFGDCPPDVQNEKVRIFFDSVRDAAGNLPTWLQEVEV